MRVRFGDCVLDTDTRELFRRDEPVHLPPKAFRLLELLVENRPRAVSKGEIHDRIWPGTYVSEATLASAISDIRAAVGKDGRDSSIIRTVHGYGYAFSSEAVAIAPQPAVAIGVACVLVCEEREIPLHPGDNILGRGKDVSVQIHDQSISRHHAKITVHGESATIEDLNSRNGTFLAGASIHSPLALNDGDEIRVGDVTIIFRCLSDSQSTRTGTKEPRRQQVSHNPRARASRQA